MQDSYFGFHDVLDKRVAQSLSGDLYCLEVFCLFLMVGFLFLSILLFVSVKNWHHL